MDELRLELVSADCIGSLRILTEAGICILSARRVDPLTVQFRIRSRDWNWTQKILSKRGEKPVLLGEKGPVKTLRGLTKRPVLLVGILLVLGLTIWMPSRILFIQVKGNERIPAVQILQAAENCGLIFGANRKALRSEQIKNNLLKQLPALKWAGVNTTGCTATIHVTESTPVTQSHSTGGVGNLVAATDGVIQEILVYQGNALCRVGEAVSTGQILISGYTDCGIVLRAQQASGEVFALTRREITVRWSAQAGMAESQEKPKRLLCLLIGKKRINLCLNSRIWDPTCGRMYKEFYLTLPGGFRLPLGIGINTVVPRRITAANEPPAQSPAEWVRTVLGNSMVSGRILDSDETLADNGMVCRYLCREMIAATQCEQMGE